MHQLIEQCQRGNAFAQRRLYDQYVHRFFRVCLRYVGHEPDAEEVLMNAFLKIFRCIGTFIYRDQNGFEAWMRRIVVNECLLHLRNRRTLPVFSVDTNSADNHVPEPAPRPDEVLNAEELYAFICELPPGYRTVFNLYVVEGYSHHEIAEQLHIAENTSKSQLSKARALLQTWLTRHGYDRQTRQSY
jgi:RNA polymerase sigma factor (sigma-70 family)